MEAYYTFEKQYYPTAPEDMELRGWNLPEDQEIMEEYENKMEEMYNAVPEWK